MGPDLKLETQTSYSRDHVFKERWCS